MVKFLDRAIYWLMIVLPFFMGIAPAPMNIFMGFLIFFFVLKKIIKKESFFCKLSLNLPLLLFFLITCVSIVYSINIKDTLKGGILRTLQYMFIFYIFVQELRDRRHIWRLFLSMTVGLLLISIDEIWQVATGRDFIRGYATILNIGLVRATASFKDANILGIYLSAMAPLVFGLTLYYFKGKKKVIFSVASALVLTGICLTYSRPTLLATYLVLFFFAIVKKSRILLVVLIIFTVAAPFIAPGPVKQWARSVDYHPLRFMCNDDRISIYRNSINMIKAYPVMGLGANTFMKNYKKYKEYPEYRNAVTSDFVCAHNTFLQMAGELGFIGLVVFLWLLWRLFKESIRIYRRLDDHFFKVVSLSLIACLIAFQVNGLTESSFFYSRVAMIFWIIAGFSLALRRFCRA